MSGLPRFLDYADEFDPTQYSDLSALLMGMPFQLEYPQQESRTMEPKKVQLGYYTHTPSQLIFLGAVPEDLAYLGRIDQLLYSKLRRKARA